MSATAPKDIPRMKSKREWASDSISKQCLSCGDAFGMINRKHHCRLCGKVYCGICASKEVLLLPAADEKDFPQHVPMTGRICDLCYTDITGCPSSPVQDRKGKMGTWKKAMVRLGWEGDSSPTLPDGTKVKSAPHHIVAPGVGWEVDDDVSKVPARRHAPHSSPTDPIDHVPLQ